MTATLAGITYPTVNLTQPLALEAARVVAKELRVLFVDDDDNYREVVTGELEDLGFNVTSFSDAPPLIEYLLSGHDGDVIVLDWSLPSMIGGDLISELRRRGIRTPVIVLTGHSKTEYEVEALDKGAIDFVDKARGIEVLACRARLTAESTRRPERPTADEVVVLGPLLLRPRLCRAYWNNQDVDLTVTEFKIIHRLVENAGEHVSYRSIYDCVHHCGFIAGNGEDGYRTNVRSCIKRIRNKFRGIDPSFAEIENFAAFGYGWRKRADIR